MGQQYDDREWRRRQQERSGDPANDEGWVSDEHGSTQQESGQRRGASYNRRSGYERSYSGQDRDDERYQNERGYSRQRDNDREGQGYAWSYNEYPVVPGPYSGVGPRDYRRTDERIFEDVCERLAQHGQIDASDIEVKVENGEVTLDGSIADRRMKRLAEDVIESIWGVNDIHNHLRIRETRSRTYSDREQRREREQDHPQDSTTVTSSPADLGESTITTPAGELGAGSNIMGMPDTGIASRAAAVDLDMTEADLMTDETDAHDTGQDLHPVDLTNDDRGMGMHGDTVHDTGMMSGFRDQLHEGMDVMAADGEMVGTVKEIRESDFLLDRPMARDFYIPYDSAEISGERVRLTIPADQISRMDWPSPDLFGS